MKQLLIVNSGKALNATGATPKDLSKLDAGAITFFELGEDTALSVAPTKNFGIALGRPNGQLPFVIPEVDLSTLSVTKATPMAGTKFKVVVTMPATVIGKEYTLRFFKKGAQPHERNSWTVGIVAKTTTPATEAASMAKLLKEKVSNDFNFNVTVSGAVITVESANYGDAWTVMAVDTLPTSAITVTDMVPVTGDKTYIEDLASRCAAGKGFRDTDYQGREYLPGYPETVEDTTYNIYSLRFQVGRAAAKTRDDKVWQIVHIAVPVSATAASAINTILNIKSIEERVAELEKE